MLTLCSMWYRVAKYQEANPGVFTIVTFPFLFAVMFGDWGHGICLLLATMYLIIREKKLASQVCLLVLIVFCLSVCCMYNSTTCLDLKCIIAVFPKIKSDLRELSFANNSVASCVTSDLYHRNLET